MKRRFIRIFLAMFIVLSLLPMSAEAVKPSLYKVTNSGNLNEQLFRIKASGDIIGSIPSNTIIEVISVIVKETLLWCQFFLQA